MFICPICHRLMMSIRKDQYPVGCCGVKHQWPVGWVEGVNKGENRAGKKVIRANCIHLGEEVDRVVCEKCGGNVQIKVLACEIHGRCTLDRKMEKTQCCRTCQDYKQGIRFVTVADLAEDTIKLATMLPKDICAIAAIPRSGLMPATLLATHLHLPLFSLCHDGFISVGCGWRLSDTNNLERPGPVLVLDDTSMYGGAMKMARVWWEKHGPKNKMPLYASVYCSPRKFHRHGPMPDIWAVDLDDPHFLEWCLFNCGYVMRMGFDLDGIMTVQDTSDPLYLPRKFEIPLIVTGRFESERRPTEAWLSRHGVKFKQMIMFPGEWTPSNLATRDQPGVIAQFKAEHWRNSGLDFFCESEPDQAETMAQIVKKPVVCPKAKKVF